MSKVLLVDDDEMVLYALSRALKQAGHEVLEAINGLKVLDIVSKEHPDVLVTDLIMPEQEGITTIAQVNALYPDLPIIAISGGGRAVDTDFLDIAMYIGATASLQKPFHENELIALIEKHTTH